jgi:4-hydroxybenzoate polyprenyltransferase
VEQQFAGNKGSVSALVEALRIQQWAKNLLVAAPAVAGQCLGQPGVAGRVAVLFMAFSLLASATYLLNDFADMDADRVHPLKRKRPLASGRLKIGTALGASAALGVAGFAIAGVWVPTALGILIVYLAANILYTGLLKRVVLLDAFALTGLYLLRLAAGHTVHPIAYSPWLFSFAMFIFLSLAFSKRAAELLGLTGEEERPGRGYRPVDLGLVTTLGVGCGIASVVLLAIYTQSAHVRTLYLQPVYLLMTVPLVLMWLGRIWLMAGRGLLEEDPLEFALRDGFTYVAVVLGVVLIFLARTGYVALNVIE